MGLSLQLSKGQGRLRAVRGGMAGGGGGRSRDQVIGQKPVQGMSQAGCFQIRDREGQR